MIFDDSSVDDQALRYSYIEFFRQTLSCSTQYYTIFSIFSKQHICTYFYFISLLLKRTECRGNMIVTFYCALSLYISYQSQCVSTSNLYMEFMFYKKK